MFRDSFHPHLKGCLHLGENVPLDADRLLSGNAMRSGKIFGKIPTKTPVPVFIGFLKKGLQLANVVNKCPIRFSYKSLILFNIFLLNFLKIPLNKRLFLLKFPQGRDITILLHARDYLCFLNPQAVVKANKLLALADSFYSSQLV